MARSLEQLGERVALALEGAAPERARAIEAARRGFLRHERIARTRTAAPHGRRFLWASAAAVVVLAAAVLFVVRRPGPLTFAINGSAGAAKS